MNSRVSIGKAAQADIAGIMDLQHANLPEQGGALAASFSLSWFEQAMTMMPVIVARKEGRVVGYLVSAPIDAYAGVPVVDAMLAAYPGAPDAYIYGPVCVAESERGRGIAGEMFSALKNQLPAREGVLLIRADNLASLAAHRKMGMNEVAKFEHGGKPYFALSYIG